MVGPCAMDASLPHWDATDVFPSLDSRQLAAAQEGLGADVDRLVAAYDEHGVGEGEPHPPSAAEVAAAETIIGATNAVERDFDVLRAYVASYVATDSRDDVAQGIASTLDPPAATLR